METKITLNKDGTPRAKGSGRKPNSFSFVKIPLGRLTATFKNENQEIVLSRKFAELFFPDAVAQSANQLIGKIKSEVNSETPHESAPSIKIVNLEDSEG